MAECQTPDLGRIKKVGLFLADDCMAPIYGTSAGYVDDCPAAVTTSDNVDEGEDFTRRCADGSIKRYLPGVRSLQSIEVNVDMHWLDPDWIAQAGGAQPVLHNGEVIGWSDCTKDRFNVIIVIWQEILGDDACADGGGNFVRVYPIKGARITEEGNVGAEDNYVRVTGLTSDSHDLGSGPLPLAVGEDGEADWLTDCLPNGCHRFRFTGGPPPEDCGVIDTVAPEVPCIDPEESPGN